MRIDGHMGGLNFALSVVSKWCFNINWYNTGCEHSDHTYVKQ